MLNGVVLPSSEPALTVVLIGVLPMADVVRGVVVVGPGGLFVGTQKEYVDGMYRLVTGSRNYTASTIGLSVELRDTIK